MGPANGRRPERGGESLRDGGDSVLVNVTIEDESGGILSGARGTGTILNGAASLLTILDAVALFAEVNGVAISATALVAVVAVEVVGIYGANR